jgi:hypothetical protein
VDVRGIYHRYLSVFSQVIGSMVDIAEVRHARTASRGFVLNRSPGESDAAFSWNRSFILGLTSPLQRPCGQQGIEAPRTSPPFKDTEILNGRSRSDPFAAAFLFST